MQVGAVVWANGSDGDGYDRKAELLQPFGGNGWERRHQYRVVADNPLAGSVVAAQVMRDLLPGQREPVAFLPEVAGQAIARVGVFVCDCTGQISEIVDTMSLEAGAEGLPGVVHTQTLAQACSDGASDVIYQAVTDHSLNRVVLAACSCCAVDQVCYSCTYQRVRCKGNLLGHRYDAVDPMFEFVNIREECAWMHENDRAAATALASAMVAAAVAKSRLSAAMPDPSLPLPKTVLIAGSSPAATVCQEALAAQGIQALCLPSTPLQIRQTPERFTVIGDGSASWSGSALVLAPRHAAEHELLMTAFDTTAHQPRTRSTWGAVDTHRLGIYFCDSKLEPEVAGLAAAARTAAWLGNQRSWPRLPSYHVDPDRCRGCGDCEQVCEFGAIQLQGSGEVRVAWIDPALCLGDGTCAARCEASAIGSSELTMTQIEAMLEAILV
jgi:heterodisulfide reductase subunit A-like polyferredoxin